MQKGRHVLDVQRTVAAGMAGRIDAALRAFEVRPHVVPAPAGVAHLPPVIEVRGHSAAIDQCIDGTRPADHAAARPIDAPPIEPGIRQRLVLPIDLRISECAPVADRRLDPESPVRAAGFENQYPVARSGGQAIRKDAAGGARADDDVVELIHLRELSLMVRPRYAISRSAHTFFGSAPRSYRRASTPSRNAAEPCMVRSEPLPKGCSE